MKICVATGWCAHNKGHDNKERSVLQNSSDWLSGVWRPHIAKQIEPDAWFFYMSKCDIAARGIEADEITNVVSAIVPAIEMQFRHDWAASVIMGAMFAFQNNLDLLYIEQDCMVKNIPAALDFARDKKLVYGFGEWSLYDGWAENSLMYISRSAIPWVVGQMINSKVGACGKVGVMLEQVFHGAVKDHASFWPFGYGRKRPIDFEQPTLYAQQLTDAEIDNFLKY